MCMSPETANLSDEQLVAIIRENDKELFGEIIRRYQTRLRHYLRKFVKHPDELEDVLQEVFIKVYRNLYGFDIEKKFSPWIYRISHNEALNHIKKYRRESVSLDETELHIVDERIDIKSDLESAQAKELIGELLGTMKEKYRAPLILYLFEEKTYDEIGDILRIPVSSVGTLIMRGKKHLKKLLEEVYGNK